MTSLVTETAVEKLLGERPSRSRAFLVSCIAGVSVGAGVYKLLRSGGPDEGTDGTE